MRRSPGSAGRRDERRPGPHPALRATLSPPEKGRSDAPLSLGERGRGRGRPGQRPAARRALTAVAMEAPAVQTAPATKAFSAFEWMVAFRYLRARNAQRSISVIAGFSFLGIVLGVAALIVVMSVMNGFCHDLMDKMIGLNGHMFLQGVETPLTDYDAVTDRVSKVPGVALAMPIVEGQAFATSPYGSAGALVRGVREADLKRLPGVGAHLTQGTLDGF